MRKRIGAAADAQVVQSQQWATAGPFGLDGVECNGALDAHAEPRGNLVGVALDQGQQLAADAIAQSEQHQCRSQRVPGTAAQQAPASADGGGH